MPRAVATLGAGKYNDGAGLLQRPHYLNRDREHSHVPLSSYLS
nr:hypothetical protein [Bartonella rattaustraliani]